MIESIDNGIQMIITALCTGITVYNWLKDGRREWILLGLFTGTYFMGDLYWQLYLVFYHRTPVYSDIPYVSWYAAYVFLLLLLAMFSKTTALQVLRRFWPVPVFTAGMCVFYMRYGSYVSNLVAVVIMSLLISRCLEGIMDKRAMGAGEDGRQVYILILVLCLLEYGMWTVSCFTSGNSIANPYYWFDVMLSVDFLLITLSMTKAVAHGLY